MRKEQTERDLMSTALAVVLAHILENLLSVESWESSEDKLGVWLHITYKRASK